MKKFKRVMALTIAMAVMFVMSACGGDPAPDSYNLSAANITVDSLTKVVGCLLYTSRLFLRAALAPYRGTRGEHRERARIANTVRQR